MKEERLFVAIGGADPVLLERSEKHRQNSWLPVGLAAACLALVLVCVFFTRDKTPQQRPPTGGIQVLQLSGTEVGELHLIQYGPIENTVPDFVIYVNEEIYSMREESGTYVIRPVNTLPEEFPSIDLTITHRSDVSPNQAAADAAEFLTETFSQVSAVTETALGLHLTAGDGNAWNAAQAEVTCVEDRQGGAFLLTARYYTEAEEGHGVRFRDMVGTFQVVGGQQIARPTWMDTLKESSDRLTQAIFSNRLSEAADLLRETSVAEGYGEDVSREITIAAVDYAIDDDQSPSSAVVSIKHRTSTEDSYNYLTLELSCEDGQWLLDWSGIEK